MQSSNQWGRKPITMMLHRLVRCKTEYNAWAVFVTHKKSIGQRGGQVTPTH